VPTRSWQIPSEIKFILALFVVTRVGLTIVGVLSHLLLDPILDPLRASHGVWWAYSSHHRSLDIWGAWDTEWYLDIAQHGYSQITNALGQANYAFFPLYPVVMRILGTIVGDNFIAGVIISNASLLGACILLYKLVAQDSDQATALKSVTYCLVFPTAFLLSAVLTESLFLMLMIGCFYYAKKRQWGYVGILGFFLSLTRDLGVVAVLPLLAEYLGSHHWDLRKIKADVWYLVLLPCGFLVFAGYLYFLTGDWLALPHLHARWYSSVPLEVGGPAVNPIPSSLAAGARLFGASFMLVSLVLLTVSRKQIGLPYWTMGMYSIVIPLFLGPTSLVSMPRFIVTIFPLYVIMAKLSSTSPYRGQIMTIGLALLQGFVMAFWTNGGYLVV
jgi:hypothetical protein